MRKVIQTLLPNWTGNALGASCYRCGVVDERSGFYGYLCRTDEGDEAWATGRCLCPSCVESDIELKKACDAP